MQKAILVGVNLNENLDFDHSMEELENLAEACEIEAAAQVVQNLPMVNNAFYIGTGKVEEVKNLVSMLDADCVIFDNSLTPSQQRNLQNQLEVPAPAPYHIPERHVSRVIFPSVLLPDRTALRASRRVATDRTVRSRGGTSGPDRMTTVKTVPAKVL